MTDVSIISFYPSVTLLVLKFHSPLNCDIFTTVAVWLRHPVAAPKAPCCSTKGTLLQHQRHPVTAPKAPCYSTKGTLFQHQRHPVTAPKAPYYSTKGTQHNGIRERIYFKIGTWIVLYPDTAVTPISIKKAQIPRYSNTRSENITSRHFYTTCVTSNIFFPFRQNLSPLRTKFRTKKARVISEP